MTQSLHIAAAEDHEAVAKLHRIAAAMDSQRHRAACGDTAVRAASLAESAARASVFAAAKSVIKLGAEPAAPTPHSPPELTLVSPPLEATRESLGRIVQGGSPRRRSRSWIVLS